MKGFMVRYEHTKRYGLTAPIRPAAPPQTCGYTRRPEPPSSRGLGRRPLTAETGVRIPVAVPRDAPLKRGVRRSGAGRAEGTRRRGLGALRAPGALAARRRQLPAARAASSRSGLLLVETQTLAGDPQELVPLLRRLSRAFARALDEISEVDAELLALVVVEPVPELTGSAPGLDEKDAQTLEPPAHLVAVRSGGRALPARRPIEVLNEAIPPGGHRKHYAHPRPFVPDGFSPARRAPAARAARAPPRGGGP